MSWWALAALSGIEGAWLGLLAVRLSALTQELEELRQLAVTLHERSEAPL